eukprot:11014099-Lingulodinium_polyedra.AAC.1
MVACLSDFRELCDLDDDRLVDNGDLLARCHQNSRIGATLFNGKLKLRIEARIGTAMFLVRDG